MQFRYQLYREGGYAALLAVRCGAHLISKQLAVERFVRCNVAGGDLQTAENISNFH